MQHEKEQRLLGMFENGTPSPESRLRPGAIIGVADAVGAASPEGGTTFFLYFILSSLTQTRTLIPRLARRIVGRPSIEHIK